MKIALLHGFNVSDGGQDTLGLWSKTLREAGHDAHLIDYGWVGLFRVRLENMDVVARLLHDKPDVIIGHSNGAAIAWQYLMHGGNLDACVCIQPALNVKAAWPWRVRRIVCLYNQGDRAVIWGRRWRRLNPMSWFIRHSWGAAGHYGFERTDRRFVQFNTMHDPVYPYSGHGIAHLGEPAVKYWVARVLSALRPM